MKSYPGGLVDTLTLAVEALYRSRTEQNDKLAQAQSDATNGFFIVCASALVFTVFVAIVFGRAISVPIKLLTRSISNVANGDYTSDVPETLRHDEIGVMANAVSQFKASLAENAALEAQSQVAVNNWRIRNALNSANTNLIVADAAGNAIFINKSMSRMLQELPVSLREYRGKEFKDNSTEALNLRSLQPAGLEDLMGGSRSAIEAEISINNQEIHQIMSPLIDDNNVHIGIVLEWND